MTDPSAKKQVRILIVEDHADTAMAMARLLGVRGHKTQVARSVAEAQAAAEAAPFDLLITDISLPDGNGIELLAELRKTLPDLRGITISGYDDPADRNRSRAAGYDAHQTKPVNFEQLSALIGRLDK